MNILRKIRSRRQIRCRYEDCSEQHPLAKEDQQVTCALCRDYLGLPQLGDA